MKKKFLFFSLLLSVLFIPGVLKSQFVFEGAVVDADSKQPIQCVDLYIYSSCGCIDTTISTDADGYFKLVFKEDIPSDSYLTVTIGKDGYRDLEKTYENQDFEKPVVYEIYSYDSESYKIDDIARVDAFDFITGFDLYSPPVATTDSKFKSVFSFYYGYEGKAKLANRMQLGFRYSPVKLKWMAMNSDTTITTIDHGKERYFEFSTEFGIYTRFILSTAGSEGHRGLFLDLGVNYDLPYYFSYTYFTDNHIKTSQNKIRKFNDFQAMMRFGFYWGSVRATYRFTNVMKDNFIEPPVLTLGVEFNIPTE